MPKRFLKYSATEPERTIMWSICTLTLLTQLATLLPFITPWTAVWFYQAANVAVVSFPTMMGLRASWNNSMEGMSRWSFWLFVIWLWSGLSRIFITSPDPSLLLWVPMIIVAVVLAVVHIFCEGVVKAQKAGEQK